jgi:hypothetical protein
MCVYFAEVQIFIKKKKYFQFSSDDELPNIVCSQCHKKIEKYIDFRNNCLATYKILQEFLLKISSTVVKKEDPADFDQALDDRTADTDSLKNEVTCIEASTKEQPPKIRKTRLCVICGKQVKRLNQHIKFHTREKLYECFHCQKKFYSRGNFISHVRIHLCIKNYKCDQCPLEFVGTSGELSMVVRLFSFGFKFYILD